jgi:flagellar basal-body rod protein FlgF
MDASGYTTLTRQSGLMAQMGVIAHNIANISTTGFRREGVVFSEYVQGVEDGPSISMAYGNARVIDLSQAGISQTGGRFDFALQGDGFFQVATPQGTMLTRAGDFTPSPDGQLLTTDGFALLDEGGSPVFVPPTARSVALAQDGTLSADGAPLAKLGVVMPDDPNSLTHQMGTLFTAGNVQPVASPVVLQGFLEDSNVDAVSEVAKMIAVQRAYEMGQGFLDREDERLKTAIQTLGR